MRARRHWIPALAATTLVFGCQAAPGDVAAYDLRTPRTGSTDLARLRAAGTADPDARVRAHELLAKRTPAIK